MTSTTDETEKKPLKTRHWISTDDGPRVAIALPEDLVGVVAAVIETQHSHDVYVSTGSAAGQSRIPWFTTVHPSGVLQVEHQRDDGDPRLTVMLYAVGEWREFRPTVLWLEGAELEDEEEATDAPASVAVAAPSGPLVGGSRLIV